MHIIQEQLLNIISSNKNLGSKSLRSIAEMIGAKGKPQTAKYHLLQLEQKGFIQMNLDEGILKVVKKGYNLKRKSPLYSIPIIGTANCGPATIYAQQNIDRYLKVSSGMLPKNKKSLFALIADGPSMNKVSLTGKNIESGDFVLIDSNVHSYKNGDIVVAIIDGMATIKRYHQDIGSIRLEADSTEDYLPIYLEEGDNFIINGKVVGVIKRNSKD